MNALKAACQAQAKNSEQLREILLVPAPVNTPSISSFGFCTGAGLSRPQLVMNSRSKNPPLEEARTHLAEVIHSPLNGSGLMFCCYNHTFALIGEMSQNCKFSVLFSFQFIHLYILRCMDVDIDFSLKLEALNQCLPSVHGADAACGNWGPCYNGPRKSVLLQGIFQCPNRTTETAAGAYNCYVGSDRGTSWTS